MYTLKDKLCILFGENGLTVKKFFQLSELYDTADELVRNFDCDDRIRSILGNSYGVLKSAIKKNDAERIIFDMEQNRIEAVTWYSEKYPRCLRDIDEPPYILFCKGDITLLSKNCLSVVGTRKVSSYGRRIATDFTRLLAEHFVIVSGLAYGVDSIAHETTLTESGLTIAVLGSGILNIYPPTNENLADRILKGGGLIISEYGLRASPLAYHFPHRNRIVAGLSRGLLVCQAPLKSGTNSTVELALEQGKDVFVVPGEIYDSGFSGSNALIKSMQGACVTTPRDIIDFYNLESKQVENKIIQLNFEEQKIVDVLTVGQKSFDQLVCETGFSPSDLNFLLANLELRSIIARLPGNSYRIYGGTE